MLVSKKELTNPKLRAIKSDDLKELAGTLGVDARGTASNLIKNVKYPFFRQIFSSQCLLNCCKLLQARRARF